MGPILSAIGKFCSFREEHTAGHHMMSFLQLKPASMSLRDVTQLVGTIEDRLQSTPKRYQPPQEMLFAHLWNDAPGGCGFRTWSLIAEDARDIVKSSTRSKLRTFEHLMTCIKGALSLKREAWNLASVQKSLAVTGVSAGNAMPAVPTPYEDLSPHDKAQDCPEPAPVDAMPFVAPKGEEDKGGKGKRARSNSKNARNSLLVAGAEWPTDEKGSRKKIADFSATQKKLVLCMWERKEKGACSRGADCDFCHIILAERRKGKKKERATSLRAVALRQPARLPPASRQPPAPQQLQMARRLLEDMQTMQ